MIDAMAIFHRLFSHTRKSRIFVFLWFLLIPRGMNINEKRKKVTFRIPRVHRSISPGRLVSANIRNRLLASRFSPTLISPSLLYSPLLLSFLPLVPFRSADERLVHLLVMVWILPGRPTGRRTSHLEFDQKYLRWRLLLSLYPDSPLPSLSFAASRTFLPRLRKSPIGPHRRVKRRSTSGGRAFRLLPARRDDPEETLPKEFKLVPARVYRTKINWFMDARSRLRSAAKADAHRSILVPFLRHGQYG